MKPSPSPWKIQDQQIIAADESVVCEIYDATEADIANSKLIAVAPEMLAALEHILEYWNRDTGEESMLNALEFITEKAANAIAKARGDA